MKLTQYRDWKKLTFYYYAEAYVNFNSLVTDLFKIYKTRIWMSAINPASFVSPTSGIQLSSGTGNMPSFRERERFSDGRSKPEELGGMAFTTLADMQSAFTPPWASAQETPAPSSLAPTAYGHFFAGQPQTFQGMGIQTQDFTRGVYPSFRPPSPLTFQQYGAIGNVRSPGPMNPHYDQSSRTTYPEQLNAFQGLSLGS
jgi:hypothetical protein